MRRTSWGSAQGGRSFSRAGGTMASALATWISFLDVTGDICEELTGYTFENVLRLADDFGRGDFAPALGVEGHRSIFERWFLRSGTG